MSIRLPARHAAFPRSEGGIPRANAWASQWKHLPGSPKVLVRNAMRGALRTLHS